MAAELGAAVCFTTQTIAPTPYVPQGTQLHTCSPPSSPGAENKRTPTHQGHYLDGGGEKDCRWERKEGKLKGIQSVNQQ